MSDKTYKGEKLYYVKRGDHLVIDDYPTFIVLENHRRDQYFWCYCTLDNNKFKIRYIDVDEIYKVNEDTGELQLYYYRVIGRNLADRKKSREGE